MRSLLLALLLSCTYAVSGQNAFYDAQFLASVTANQVHALKLYATDTVQLSADEKKSYYTHAVQQGDLSDEERAASKACYTFLTANNNDLFSADLKRTLLNTPLLKQILAKLAVVKITDEQGAYGFTSPNGSPSASPALSGLGNVFSRLGSADFENMLIDATATYIAESFKQDVVYTFFLQAQGKLKSMPEFTTLFPKTCDKISKLDPFNFNDLGNAWKQAFESDIQALPVSFRDFVKNGPPNTWYGKLNTSKFFTYYSYSIDILQPLVKGYHPLEILEMLDKQYMQNVAMTPLDEYQGIIHFLNILQAGVQDSTKKGSGQTAKTWISFNQLKELNTDKELLYFFSLLYQQDRDFFENNAQLGQKIKRALFNNDPATLKKVVDYLSDFLILLNQVETSISDINQAKSQKQNSTELISTYMRNVLAILKQTNTILGKIGIDNTLTTSVSKYLNYGDMAYNLYNSITAQNYSALIDNSLQLLDSITGNNNFSTLLKPNLATMMASYNSILALRAKPALALDDFTQLVMTNWNGKGVLADNMVETARTAIDYASIAVAGTKTACDNALTAFKTQIEQINVYLLQGSNGFDVANTLLVTYNAVYTAMGTMNINVTDLFGVASGWINQNGIDKKALDNYLRTLPAYKTITDAAIKVRVETAIGQLNLIVDQVNIAFMANSKIFNRVLQVAADLAKYGKIVAMIANAQNSTDLKNVIKTYVMPSGSFAVQRSSLSTVTVSAMVGAIGSAETDINNIWTKIRPNIGLTAPIGLEWTWGTKSDKPTSYKYLGMDGKTKYLTGASHSIFLQVFDIVAPLNYRLTKDSGSLPAKITLAQLFSPGLSYNLGLPGLPFDVGAGIQYTPSLRTIGTTPQANSLRIFLRFSWVKPLIPIYIRSN